ncbi:MAG: hypothetical protein EZS28_002133 [Streblomastix strix]|uniref:Uncharacterized protein n=1 Tax=Streblomastix strix TaxID=222440 RepID=A0A5J4X532_9EUKA|nr:MAG: hypothetical protein EZS28_002133 [Streblomastix strix]
MLIVEAGILSACEHELTQTVDQDFLKCLKDTLNVSWDQMRQKTTNDKIVQFESLTSLICSICERGAHFAGRQQQNIFFQSACFSGLLSILDAIIFDSLNGDLEGKVEQKGKTNQEEFTDQNNKFIEEKEQENQEDNNDNDDEEEEEDEDDSQDQSSSSTDDTSEQTSDEEDDEDNEDDEDEDDEEEDEDDDEEEDEDDQDLYKEGDDQDDSNNDWSTESIRNSDIKKYQQDGDSQMKIDADAEMNEDEMLQQYDRHHKNDGRH